MIYHILDVESKVYGRNMLHFDIDCSAAEYALAENEIIKTINPYYVEKPVHANKLSEIHAFEELGFRFAEFRIERHLQIAEKAINPLYFYPFGCELLNNDPDTLKQMLKIAVSYGSDDRFTLDPYIANDFAAQRLTLYITRSLNSYPTQFVYGLKNLQTGELIGFRTGSFEELSTARYFYHFIKKGFKDPKYSSMLESLVQDALQKRKIRRIEAVSSGLNVQELNDSSLMQGFVVDRTMVLLRKIFERA